MAMSFEQALTTSDVNGELTLFKPCADALFPIVGETKIFRDRRGRTFELRHAFYGNPGRHRLSKDWRKFVRETRAAEGDTVILTKDAAGRLFIDLRRTSPELERHQGVVQPVARRRPRGAPPVPPVGFSLLFPGLSIAFLLFSFSVICLCSSYLIDTSVLVWKKTSWSGYLFRLRFS